MTQRLLIALLAIVMSVHVTGCTSGGSSDDTEVAESNDETFAEEGEGDFADESSEVAEEAPTDESTADSSVADAGADDLGVEDQASNEAAPEEPLAEGDVAASDDLSLDDPAAPTDEVAANDQPENITDAPTAPTDEAVFNEPPADATTTAEAPPAEPVVEEPVTETSIADAAPETEAAPAPSYVAAPPVNAPYLKAKEAAFTADDGTTLNRVYVSRPGDNSKAVATKVYGEASRSRDLVKWNPSMKNGLTVGEKIYYSSPSNPSDTRMLTYFEEAGIAPQMYVAKDSDNFRETSKSLLGFDNAWKEIYATNPNVTEKTGRLPTGLEVRYWPDGSAPAVPVTTAQTTPPTAPDMSQPNDMAAMPNALPDQAPPVPPSGDQAAMAPPADPFQSAPPAVAANDPLAPPQAADPLAPPQSPDMAASGTVGGADPLAPPPTEAIQAPPPKPVVKRAPMPEADEESTDADTMMALGAGGVLLLAAALLFVLIRKNRAKRMDLGQTQV